MEITESVPPVGRFFCDVAAMRLRFGCDGKRESLCKIDLMTLGSLGLRLAAELEGDPCPYAGRYSFGAGRTIVRQAGTLRGT